MLEKQISRKKKVSKSLKRDERQYDKNRENTIHEKMEVDKIENEVESQRTSNIKKYLNVDEKLYMYYCDQIER